MNNILNKIKTYYTYIINKIYYLNNIYDCIWII